MLKARSDVVASSVLEDEATIIHMETKVYYALDGVGAAIWQALTTGTSLDTLVQELTPQYQVEPGILRADCARLLEELREEGLIEEVADQEPPALPRPEGEAPRPYAVPILQSFDDMQQELALDPPLPTVPRVLAQ